MKRHAWARLGLLLLGLLLGLGFGRLFQLRFDAGDVYPAYSSWRTDPLGTKALHDSLAEQPGARVRRHFRPLEDLPEGKKTALLLLGLALADFERVPTNEAETIERFAREGGRLVLAFGAMPRGAGLPLPGGTSDDADREAKRPDKPPREGSKDPAKPARQEKSARGQPKPRLRHGLAQVSLRERWGLQVKQEELETGGSGYPQPAMVQRVGETPTPRTLAWHSPMCLVSPATNWSTIYGRGDQAVVLERRMGLGTVVLCTDSYLFSNEALRRDRQPEFLAWVVGGASDVWFEETHLGVREEPGIANLIRKYRLHGLVLGLLLLAGLFVWRQVTPFVPPSEAGDTTPAEGLEAGRDFTGGLVNLLRRSVAPAELPVVCLEEWRRSCIRERLHLLGNLESMSRILREYESQARKERDAVLACRTMAAVLARRFARRGGSPPGSCHEAS